jgi:hypothetical protein
MRRLGMVWLLGSALLLVDAMPALTAPLPGVRIEALVVDTSHGPAEVGPVTLTKGKRYVLDVSGVATQTSPNPPAADETFEDDPVWCFQSGGSGLGCTPPFLVPSTLLQIGIGAPSDLVNAFPSQTIPYSTTHRYMVNFVPPKTGKLAAANPFTLGDESGNTSTYSGLYSIIVYAPPSHCQLSFRFATDAYPSGRAYVVRAHGVGTLRFDPNKNGTCAGPYTLTHGLPTKKTTLVHMQVSPARRLTMRASGAVFRGRPSGDGDMELFTTVTASNDRTCPAGSSVDTFVFAASAKGRANEVIFEGVAARKGKPACKIPRESLASAKPNHVSVTITTPVALK